MALRGTPGSGSHCLLGHWRVLSNSERLEAGGKQSFNNALQALKKQGQVSFPGDPQPKSAKAPASKFKRRSGPGG